MAGISAAGCPLCGYCPCLCEQMGVKQGTNASPPRFTFPQCQQCYGDCQGLQASCPRYVSIDIPKEARHD